MLCIEKNLLIQGAWMATKARDSRQVEKARKKLRAQIETEQKKVNEKTINQMKQAMQIWLKRHKQERIKLADLPIEVFDENRHSAKTQSKFVVHLMSRLKHEAVRPKSLKPLKGRLKS